MSIFSLPNLLKKLRKKPVVKKPALLATDGAHYNLKQIYDKINATYFEGKLKLNITWMGSASRCARRHRKLGVYYFRTKVIGIHRLLDHPHFPPYFISYVVYHEMLHSVCPPVKGRKGRFKIHHSNFKEREKDFADYEIAKRWEKENVKLFFASRE